MLPRQPTSNASYVNAVRIAQMVRSMRGLSELLHTPLPATGCYFAEARSGRCLRDNMTMHANKKTPAAAHRIKLLKVTSFDVSRLCV